MGHQLFVLSQSVQGGVLRPELHSRNQLLPSPSILAFPVSAAQPTAAHLLGTTLLPLLDSRLPGTPPTGAGWKRLQGWTPLYGWILGLRDSNWVGPPWPSREVSGTSLRFVWLGTPQQGFTTLSPLILRAPCAKSLLWDLEEIDFWKSKGVLTSGPRQCSTAGGAT